MRNLTDYCPVLPDVDSLPLDQVASGYQPSRGSGFEGDIRFPTLWRRQQCSEAGTTHLKKRQVHFLQGSSPEGCHLRRALALGEASRQVKSAPSFSWGRGVQSHCGDSLVYPIHDLTVVPFVYAVQGCPEVAGWEGIFWHVQEWPGRWVRKLCKVADEFKSGHKLSTVGSCFSSKRWTSAV